MNIVLQKPTDLKLAILRTELPANLTTLKQAVVFAGDWQFSFHIVGESHLVRIEHRRALVLQEVLACIDVAAAQCVDWHQFSDLAEHRYDETDYEVGVTFDDRPDSTGSWADSSAGLVVEFPAIYGCSPVTRIRWELAADRIRWWTLHLYPEPRRITRVLSHSEFRWQ